VLLSMLRFLDDAISNAFCDLRRVEALKHKIEEDSSQDRLRWLRIGEPGTLGLLANPSSRGTILIALQPSGRGVSSSIGVPVRMLQGTSTLAFFVMPLGLHDSCHRKLGQSSL
jgi:hypothetical protein